MSTQENHWKKLTLSHNADLSEAVQQQHYGSQFIALIGRHLIPQETDDSNTSMTYIISEKSLRGMPMTDGLCLELDLTGMSLRFRKDESGFQGKIPLAGKTKQEVFSLVKQTLSELGSDTSNLKNELHYQLPDHPLDNGAKFKVKNSVFFQENTNYRHNAEIVLNQLVKDYQDASPVRVWPHHFDTGTYIPLSYNSNGDISKSLGLGWAIADSMVDEPYFYLSYWSEDPVKNFDRLPEPESGQWISSGWQGGVLKLSDILGYKTGQEQYDSAKKFFYSAIRVIQNYF